jgi:uncharacterized PurR-regulated membrane protein YhhQ (DUF165 family)
MAQNYPVLVHVRGISKRKWFVRLSLSAMIGAVREKLVFGRVIFPGTVSVTSRFTYLMFYQHYKLEWIQRIIAVLQGGLSLSMDIGACGKTTS